MSAPNNSMFPQLDPPTGGLARLQARLDAGPSDQRGRQRQVWFVAGALGLAAAGITLLLALPSVEPIAKHEPIEIARQDPVAALFDGVDHPVLVSWGRQQAPAEPVSLRGGLGTTALERVPTSDKRVVMYRVQTIE